MNSDGGYDTIVKDTPRLIKTQNGCKMNAKPSYKNNRSCLYSVVKQRLKTGNAYNCASIGSLYISHLKQIIQGMRRTLKLKCWKSQTVRKSAESTVNTNQDKNKDRLGVRKSLVCKKDLRVQRNGVTLLGSREIVE